MNEIAAELRQLASDIEKVSRASRVHSIAWDQVSALTDYLTLRARVIELDHANHDEKFPRS